MAAAEADRELDALVPQAAAGDQAALARIMAIIQPPLLRYTRARITGGRHPNAEDVTQEICLAVATSIPNYVDRGRPFMAFVYGIAANKVADAHRFFARDVANPTEDVPETEHDSFTPEQFALVSERSNRVRLYKREKLSPCACSLVLVQKKLRRSSVARLGRFAWCSIVRWRLSVKHLKSRSCNESRV